MSLTLATYDRVLPKRFLVVDGATFRVSDGETVDLRLYDRLRRIFVRLVHAHREMAGRCVSIPDLFDAGWPEDEMDEAPLEKQRELVFDAISRLRRRGLGPVLAIGREGYRIHPHVCVIAEGLPCSPEAELSVFRGFVRFSA